MAFSGDNYLDGGLGNDTMRGSQEMIYFMEKMGLTLCMAIKEMMTSMEMR